MLVIVSDIHIGDGTCGQSISPEAFHTFIDNLRVMAYNASWRTDHTYRPIKQLDLLMLGDIMETLHSTHWLDTEPGDKNYTRPWEDTDSPVFAQKIDQITDAILEHNQKGIAFLHKISQEQELRIPPADSHGKPAMAAEPVPIDVHIHYMIGNHDWFFGIPNPSITPIRQKVIDAFGLDNPSTPFPHDPTQNDTLMSLFKQYGVFARHGDIYDAFNYNQEMGRNFSTLGDALSIELLNRFPIAVEEQLGDSLPPGFYRNLRELVNVRPSLAAPLWISGKLKQYCDDQSVQNKVKNIWDSLGQQFVELPFIKSQDSILNPMDSVDLLQLVFELSGAISFDTINDLVVWIRKKMWNGEVSYAKHALQEPAFLEKSARYIVYGHTHHYEIIPLDSTLHNGELINQIYINSGTWHTYFDLTVRDPQDQKFVPYSVMSYLAFYHGDERRGQKFESWSGALT